jgi:hypothetical protein
VVTDAAVRTTAPGSALDRLSVLTAAGLLIEVALSLTAEATGHVVAMVLTLVVAPVPLVLSALLIRGLRREHSVTPGRRAAAWTIAILTIGVIVFPIAGMGVLYVLLASTPGASL